MPTLGGLEYAIDTFYDAAAGTKALNPPANCRAILVGMGARSDPYGTVTFGGVAIPQRIGEGHYGRDGALYARYDGLDGRSDDDLVVSSVSGSGGVQIIVVTIGGSVADGGHHSNSEYTGWAVLTDFDTTHTDPGVGEVYKVGALLPIGEADLGGQTPTWDSTTGAASAHIGAGGASNTGVAMGLFVQGPDESSMNMGASGDVGLGRMWVATSGYLVPAGPSYGPMRKVPSIIVA